MKPVILFDFLKRLSDNGVNLRGCCIQSGLGGSSNYRYLWLTEGNVKVSYGIGHRDIGSLSKGLRVENLVLSTKKSGKKIVGISDKNESITINFSTPPSRW